METPLLLTISFHETCLSMKNKKNYDERNSAASASSHALYPSRWYAENRAGVKYWLAEVWPGKEPQHHSETARQTRLWQHSQQQNVSLSTSSASSSGPVPHWPASRSTLMSRNASFQVTRSSVWTPLLGCLGAIKRIFPSPTFFSTPPSASRE